MQEIIKRLEDRIIGKLKDNMDMILSKEELNKEEVEMLEEKLFYVFMADNVYGVSIKEEIQEEIKEEIEEIEEEVEEIEEKVEQEEFEHERIEQEYSQIEEEINRDGE